MSAEHMQIGEVAVVPPSVEDAVGLRERLSLHGEVAEQRIAALRSQLASAQAFAADLRRRAAGAMAAGGVRT